MAHATVRKAKSNANLKKKNISKHNSSRKRAPEPSSSASRTTPFPQLLTFPAIYSAHHPEVILYIHSTPPSHSLFIPLQIMLHSLARPRRCERERDREREREREDFRVRLRHYASYKPHTLPRGVKTDWLLYRKASRRCREEREKKERI